MRMMTSKYTALAAAAFISLAGIASMPSSASAEVRADNPNLHNVLSDNRANRGLRHRGGLRNEDGNWNHRYRGSNHSYYNNGYRRYNRNGGFGIYLNLGDNSSGCGYQYRKWKYTGSRYWRSQYYNCIG